MFFIYMFIGILLGLLGYFIYCAIDNCIDFIKSFDKIEQYDVIDLDDPEEEDDSCGKI